MEETTAKVFDRNAMIQLTIPTKEGGGKHCEVRYPSDEQWLRRSRRLRLVTRPNPEGKGVVTELENEAEAEREAFDSIVVSQNEQLCDEEAITVMDRLDRHRVADFSRHGDQVEVHLQVPGAMTLHRLRMPSAKEHIEYKRSLPAPADLGRGKIMQSYATGQQAALYDKISLSVEGYANGVPLNHKAGVARVVLELLNETTEDMDFF